jgi:eukaryotic-like serine/threonine-protein kinase
MLNPALSPDGRRVAVNRTVQNNIDIWLIDEAARMTRFTFDANPDVFPVWSPDGSQIAFSSSRKGLNGLYAKLSSSANAAEVPLLESPPRKGASDWSPDGRFLTYLVVTDAKSGAGVWAVPVQGDKPSIRSGPPDPSTGSGSPRAGSKGEAVEGGKPFPVADGPFGEVWGQFSPDGQWMAYMSNESGLWEIYVRPFQGSGGQSQVSTSGGVYPRWSRDGKELYYVAPDAKLMAVPIAAHSSSTVVAGSPAALFQMHIVGGGANIVGRRHQYAVAPDGRFLVNVPAESATSAIRLIVNWKPPVEK